jgi:hypothetical protein
VGTGHRYPQATAPSSERRCTDPPVTCIGAFQARPQSWRNTVFAVPVASHMHPPRHRSWATRSQALAPRLVSSRVLGKSKASLVPVRKSDVSGTRNIGHAFLVLGFDARVRCIGYVGRGVGTVRGPAAFRPTAQCAGRIRGWVNAWRGRSAVADTRRDATRAGRRAADSW